MATLDMYQAKRRLQDGELLHDSPKDHARWKLGKDTVREITVQKWIKRGQLTEVSPSVWKWSGDEPYFIQKKYVGEASPPEARGVRNEMVNLGNTKQEVPS